MDKEKHPEEPIVTNRELDFQGEKQAIELVNYKQFFHNTIDLACFANTDGYFEELNDTFTKVLGYAKEELLSKRFLEFIHPDDVDPTLQRIKELSLGIKVFNFTNRYKSKSGAYKHIEWNAIFNTETKKICAVGRDVTGRLIATNELAFQNEEKGKRSAELTIANKELAFQNEEKGKRSAELTIANKELAFQNEEKGKRSAELTVANKELAIKNEEKEPGKKLKSTRVTNQQKLLLFSFIILASMGFVGYGIYKSNGKHLDAERWVQHTEQVIYQSGNILSLGKDVENASRGFVITNDSSFLEPLYTAEKIAVTYIKQLRQLTLDNPSQQQRVDSLNFYMQKRLDFSLQMVAIRSKQGLASAIAYTSTRNGKFYTDQIRQFTNLIKEEEGNLLQQRKQTNKRNASVFNRFSVVMFILITVFTILLLIATANYFFQNREKEKRAAALIIANKELAFQNEEKGKRAAELTIANKELAFQNEEKGKRAAELTIANKELAFQNEEKGKRAAELTIANKELAFQNEEKGKRAAELLGVNLELKKAEAGIRILNEELEQKVIERTAQLETVNKELESFSYSVSHDLRAPIRAINGYAKILEEDYIEKFDEDGTKVLYSIVTNSKRMGNLIDDLLAFSKLGRKPLTVLAVSMEDIVKAIKEELLLDDSTKKIEFTLHEIPPAKADLSLIKQVWINLISNAIKYSKYKPEPVIEIGAFEKDKLVIYYIKDNGAGFDMKYYDKLFGVFQRLHSQEEFDGTGIGLAIVQKIVHRHNGTVWAESTPGEGACFYFSLPAI